MFASRLERMLSRTARCDSGITSVITAAELDVGTFIETLEIAIYFDELDLFLAELDEDLETAFSLDITASSTVPPDVSEPLETSALKERAFSVSFATSLGSVVTPAKSSELEHATNKKISKSNRANKLLFMVRLLTLCQREELQIQSIHLFAVLVFTCDGNNLLSKIFHFL